MLDQIVITFTAQQLDIVANALGHRPYIEAAPVLDELRKQIAAQQPPGPVPSDAPPADGAAPLQ
jgi:hypothetical protein